MTLALDYYRLLGNTGLRVSPLCLGTMTFGEDWGWGTDENTSRQLLDRYSDAGGNFLDTANFYTGGSSESILGNLLKDRRERFVLGTKYTLSMRSDDPNAGGNHRKNMVQSLEASLKRLKTDYIDLYWVHAWEFRTPIEEVMRGLDDLVRQGKILYTAISDAPAWKVAEANTLARLRGWTPFSALQLYYNLVDRTSERDMIPMARELGIGVMPWSPLAGGVLTGKYSKDDLAAEGSAAPEGSRRDVTKALGMLTERNLEVAEAVHSVATEVGATPAQVALRWILDNPGVTSVLLGARTLKQLDDNLGCLSVELSAEQRSRLDAVSAIEPGFPHDFMATEQFKMVIDGENSIEGEFAVCSRPRR